MRQIHEVKTRRESCEMSQKTRSYPSLGEGWDLRVGPSGQCHQSLCPIVGQKQAQF